MTDLSTKAVAAALVDHGWARFDLPDPGPVFAARDALLAELRRLSGDAAMELETYHQAASDHAGHTKTQWALTKFWRCNRFAHAIFEAQRRLFESVLGPDILTQPRPYLRVARPGLSVDNVGYHRDTVYGAGASDVSVVFPLVDLPPSSALMVLPGSHVRPDADFPCRRLDDLDVPRFGCKHSMGFFYSPYVYDPWFEPDLEAVDMRVGQCLMFATSLIHGQKVNRGPITRWTTDFGVSRGAGSGVLDGYAMTAVGARFAAANRVAAAVRGE